MLIMNVQLALTNYVIQKYMYNKTYELSNQTDLVFCALTHWGRKIGRHFADDIFKWILYDENFYSVFAEVCYNDELMISKFIDAYMGHPGSMC